MAFWSQPGWDGALRAVCFLAPPAKGVGHLLRGASRISSGKAPSRRRGTGSDGMDASSGNGSWNGEEPKRRWILAATASMCQSGDGYCHHSNRRIHK